MTQRIIGFDVARCFAVFGMVIVNFKIAMGADAEPAWLAQSLSLLEGRAAAIFVVLAGVGLALMSGGPQPSPKKLPAVKRTLLKRALFLLLVGLAYTPIWPADILHFYGIYLMFGALMLGASRRFFALAAAVAVSGFMLLMVFLDYSTGWHWETLHYSDFWSPAGMMRHLFFNGFHPVFPWVGFLFLGLILGRTSLQDVALRRRLILLAGGIALATESTSRLLASQLQGDLVHLVTTGPMPPNPFYMIAAGATAVAFILICVHLTLALPKLALWQPLIATGRLALTLYVAHVVVGMGTLEAMGMLGAQPLSVTLLAASIFCIGGLIFSWLWCTRYKQGPLEWVMRRVTGD